MNKLTRRGVLGGIVGQILAWAGVKPAGAESGTSVRPKAPAPVATGSAPWVYWSDHQPATTAFGPVVTFTYTSAPPRRC